MLTRRVFAGSAFPVSKASKVLEAWLTSLALAAQVGLAAPPSAQVTTFVRSVSGDVTVAGNGQPGEQKAKAGMTLLNGAKVTGESDSASLQIECSNRGTQTLTRRFDAVIDTLDANTGCAVDLLSGTAVATTGPAAGGAPPGVASILGPVSMISHHTQFGLAVEKFKSGATTLGFVIEGSASLNRGKAEEATPVAAGSQVDPDTNKSIGIDPALYKRVATAYADLDLQQRARNNSQDADSLPERWLAVLRRPVDAQARVELVELQHQLGVTQSSIYAYEVQRALALAEKSGDQDLISRVKAVAAPRKPHPPSIICVGGACARTPKS